MRSSRAQRAVVAVVLTTALSGGLAGCASEGSSGGAPTNLSATAPSATTPVTPEAEQGSHSCVDWVRFDSPRDAAADAGAVLRGTVVERAGTADMFGFDANVWTFEVEEVLERPEPGPGGAVAPPELVVAAPGERISVISTPETCVPGNEEYAGGDPLDPATGLGGESGTLIVLVQAGDGTGSEEHPDGADILHLITPWQGVVTPTADGGLPAEWPNQ
ncbi:hypothetical protein AB1046_04200 [Promicromonospora sp. Populi]|uniref:hypothetical protein n=1 Tax=Promicromonospora sp. Populi TaxID=3239420 RepID=UPI0034E23894